MGNVRYNISPCTQEEASAFVQGIDVTKYISRGTVMADDNSFYDRYMYACDGERIAIVYDNRGKVISISAPKIYADELLSAFSTNGKQVKKSNLPSHGNSAKPDSDTEVSSDTVIADSKAAESGSGVRSRVFVSPKHASMTQARNTQKPMNETVRGAIISTDEIFPPQRSTKKTSKIFSQNGVETSTDEIFPPQRARKKDNVVKSYNTAGSEAAPTVQYRRTYSYGTGFVETPHIVKQDTDGHTETAKTSAYDSNIGSVINAKRSARSGRVRQTVISFGDDDYDGKPAKSYKPHTGTGVFADISGSSSVKPTPSAVEPTKPRRGRPPKAKIDSDLKSKEIPPQTEGGSYSIKNYPSDSLSAVIKRLKSTGKYNISTDATEFLGTVQEVKNYSVTDSLGQKVYLRYATGKHTLSIQGKRSDLFGEIQTQISRDSDYSSALEGYVEGDSANKGRVSEVEKRLMSKLPTATAFLSEQSKIDFSYGLHDFNQTKLHLSDYSVLLVPPYRGLERFVFDLQRAEGIKVKMIGQAFDKDEDGNYILKTAYQRRIGSVVYAEVMVALYTEYFSRRNFFAHSDNTDGNVSRSITDKAAAKKIFDNLLNVVEYNAKKLKEIGFSMTPTVD